MWQGEWLAGCRGRVVAGRVPGQGGRRGRVGGCNNLYDTPLSCFSNRNITIYGGGGG